MPGPYDSLFKEVLLSSPKDLARFIGIKCETVVELNSDVASSGRSVDMLIAVKKPNCLVQIEMQTTYDRHMPKRLLEYRVLCGLKRKSLPTMRSVLLLMCPKADGAALTGVFEQEDLRFSYEIIRLWEMDVSQLFDMSVYLMPLAPLCAADVKAIPGLLSRMDDRLRKVNISAADQREIWSKTNVLMGLRMPEKRAQKLMEALMLDIRESSTYRAIYNEGKSKGELDGKLEGRIEEARRMLINLGTSRLGQLNEEAASKLNAITDSEALEALIVKLFNGVESWQTLLV